MELCEALGLPARGHLSLVGGGGKSTLLLRLARELGASGRRAVAVTTTRITRAQGEAVGCLLLEGGAQALCAALKDHPAVCAASLCSDGKLGPPDGALLASAYTVADWVLAEADGARRLPVKAPAPHEPVLLPAGLVVAVAGLSALGRPLTEVCHRPELAAEILDVPGDAVLTPLLLARLLTSPQGQFKGVGDAGRYRVLLNQADTASGAETAREIRRILPGCRVAAAALRESHPVKEVFD